MEKVLGGTLFCLAATLSAWAGPREDYGVRSLAGLSAVRIELQAPGGVDPVDAEVTLLRGLREAGLTVAADAPAVLRADVRAGPDGGSAELTLIQALCLERDPVVSEQVPTWFQGMAVRRREGEKADAAALAGLGSLIGEFVGDWRRSNLLR